MKFLRIALAWLALTGAAYAQAQLGAGQVLGNNTAATRPPQAASIGSVLDRAYFQQPVSYPPSVMSGHVYCALNADCQFGNLYSQYPLGMVSTNPLIIGKAGSSIGSTTPAQTFKIVFTSSGLTGSPITITYTAGGAETTSTIATGLCALVNANAVLHGTGGKPIFCQPLGSGVFNLQYDAAFSATGATPLTTATTGSTGTINLTAEVNALDFIIMQLGRNAAGRAGRNGDALVALDFTGQDTTGAVNTHYGILGVTAITATAGATRGQFDFSTAGNSGSVARAAIKEGFLLYNSSGVAPTGGDLGPGTINLPGTGKLSIANANNIRNSVGQFIFEATNTDDLIFSTSGGGVGINATPTGATFTSGLGAFYSGVQVPTTGAGISLTGGATPAITARNYGTVTALPLTINSASIKIPGTSSGTGTATAPAALGTPSWVWPTNSGTFAVSATAPLVVNAATGNLSISTTAPTYQAFITGTDVTYNRPANVTYIEVEMVGGGGGGAGSGSAPGAATAGGNTCWKASGTACTTPLYQSTGGALGATGGGTAAGGGTAGSASCNDSQAGNSGSGATGITTTLGGFGGSSRWGQGGTGGTVAAAAQVTVAANTGAGGGGAGDSATANTGGGGGGGGWCKFTINAPASTYTYTVGAIGAAGTAGGSGFAGAPGSAGKIIVREYYN